jgi:hypothetical protein
VPKKTTRIDEEEVEGAWLIPESVELAAVGILDAKEGTAGHVHVHDIKPPAGRVKLVGVPGAKPALGIPVVAATRAIGPKVIGDGTYQPGKSRLPILECDVTSGNSNGLRKQTITVHSIPPQVSSHASAER